MALIEEGRCQACRAMVNPVWRHCAACHAPLEASSLQPITVEPALRPDGRPLSPVYWFSESTGRILGPAVPECVAKVGEGPGATFWIVLTHEGQTRWIRADRLRSRRDFEKGR